MTTRNGDGLFSCRIRECPGSRQYYRENGEKA